MNEPRLERRVELYSPESEVEVLLLKSVLDAAGIDYFVKNDTFGGLTPGPQIALCNRRIFLVPEDRLDEARILVRDLLHRTQAPEPRHYPLREKIRMVFEVLFFGWFLPGRRPRLPRLRLVHSAAPGDVEPARRTPEERSAEPHRGPPELKLVHPRRSRREDRRIRQLRRSRRLSERSDPANASEPEDHTPPH